MSRNGQVPLTLLCSSWTQATSLGFTVIELLVVVIIIGVLAAIGIPSMLNQTSKARQAEAKTYIGALNRSHQTFYLENQRFAVDSNELDVGIPTETRSYTYSITNLEGQQPANPRDPSYKLAIVSWAMPKDVQGVRAYLGVVDVILLSSGVGSIESILCEQSQTGAIDRSGYLSGENYNVSTIGDPTQRPECAEPFRSFH